MRRKENGSGENSGKHQSFQQILWIILILTQMAVVNRLEIRAEGPILRQVEQEIRYDNVEGAAEIPQQVTVTVSEGDQEVQAVCDLQEIAEETSEWQEGFVLPVTFHKYDADWYMIDGQMVPKNEEKPQIQGYEEVLLQAAGLSAEQYRIRDAFWDGDSYTDEYGELCRDAVAVGDKLVRSYRARYTGTAVFPEQEIVVQETGLEAEEPAAEMAEMGNAAEIEAEDGAGQDGAGRQSESQTEQESVPFSEEGHRADDGVQESPRLWERITRTLLISVGIGALFFFLGLFLLAGLRIAKMVYLWYINRRKKNKEDQEHVYRK